MKAHFLKNLFTIIVLVVNIGLSISVIFLMRHVQDLLNSDVQINLTEIVTQNKDSISSKLLLNVNSLTNIASGITQNLESAVPGRVMEAIKQLDQYALANNKQDIFVANAEGVVMRAGQATVDVSGRSYFRHANHGMPNISDRLISRMSGEEVFVISVPIYFEKIIIGTIQKTYIPEKFYELCSLSLFSDKAFMYIVNSDGYMILHNAHDGCKINSDNFFRYLYSYGNRQASEQIEKDMLEKRSGFMETKIDSLTVFSAYTAIDTIHDWYLITSVSTDVVSPNSATVIKIFYIILFVVVFIFTSSLCYFFWFKNKQRINLEQMAFVDPVTNGRTFSKFILDVQKSFEKNPESKFCVMKFDIDNFKYINNFYGFAHGDYILQQIYCKISQGLNTFECVTRIYSDNFVVLLENADEKRLFDLLKSLEDPDTMLYFSSGVYEVADRTESIRRMVDKAGMAAQAVKGAAQKAISIYTDKFEQHTVQNEQMKRAAKLALENSEFVPYYQPKINVKNGSLTGAEALARWKTSDGVLILPHDFIPLCEQTGLITEVDMLIYDKVLQFQKRVVESGIQCVPISVNFSRLHLLDKDFPYKIIEKQRRYGVPAHLIELELTESAIFDNVDNIFHFTKVMHENGFSVVMDDFGAGYSSLNMLKDIPIDILKIDKEFLVKTEDNERRVIIFSSIVEMAQRLGIDVVAEGVEHLEDINLMHTCGCIVAQGYYYSKAVQENQFLEILRAGKMNPALPCPHKAMSL